jgi:hypothetical protein
MTDKGLPAMDLVCPEGHVAGQLIRNIEHHSIGIQVPDRAREEWPRGGDKMYTLLTCHGCNRRVYGSTDAIQETATLGCLRLSPRGRADTRCATWRTA